jgi:hypothetical protein
MELLVRKDLAVRAGLVLLEGKATNKVGLAPFAARRRLRADALALPVTTEAARS